MNGNGNRVWNIRHSWVRKNTQTTIRKKMNRKLLWLKLQLYLNTSQKTFSGSLQPIKIPKLPDVSHVQTTAHCPKLIFNCLHNQPSFCLPASAEAVPAWHSLFLECALCLPVPPWLSPKPVSTQSLYHGTELLDEGDNSHDCSSPFLCVSIGAGPEVRSALASMVMERPHTFFHCRRTLHTQCRDFGGRGPHPGIPDPKWHRVLAMAITLQVAGPPTMDLCTRVTVALILDCRPQRHPSTSCLWPMTRASL